MILYETIFKRRSVRSFIDAPVESSLLERIAQKLNGLSNMEGQQVKLKILSRENIDDKKAPHYILAYCAANSLAYMNAGYVLEKVDLYLQSKGLGSLWLGTVKPKDYKEASKDELASENIFCIMLAFGNTDKKMRESENDFDRLEIEKITKSKNALAAVARLAPSAMNSQPWYLKFERNKITVEYVGRGLMKNFLKPRLSKIDLGIVSSFLEIALKNEGETIKSISPKGNDDKFSVEIEY